MERKRECKEESDEIMNNKDNQQKRAHTHQISIILNFSAQELMEKIVNMSVSCWMCKYVLESFNQHVFWSADQFKNSLDVGNLQRQEERRGEERERQREEKRRGEDMRRERGEEKRRERGEEMKRERGEEMRRERERKMAKQVR